jgi:hypothetical protein
MSLANKVSKDNAATLAEKKKQAGKITNQEIAKQIQKARRKNEDAFPNKDIETLVEMAIRVCAQNYELYPDMEGVTESNIKKEVVKQADRFLPIVTTAKNVEFEFYWEEKCKK